MSTISLYPHISVTKGGQDIPIDIFLQRIQDGYWQDTVIPIRTLPKEKQREAKKAVPYVTLSGLFSDRTDAGQKQHSGFIGIDIDDVDAEETKSLLCPDPHVYAAFTSIGGRGLCLIIKINGDKHRDAFAGISEYLFTKYNVICDPTSVNPSRPRFISFDPHLYQNTKALKFTQYPEIKAPKKIDKIVFAQTDFEAILQEIQRRHLNLCENYHDWMRIGFALADKFGEGGRSYFHIVSQFSSKYKPQDTDKQYTNCLKAHGSKLATIATFYYYCKLAGITTYSQQTKTVMSAAVNGKKSGVSAATTVKNLEKFEAIPAEASADIVNQVFENNIEFAEETLITQVEQWIKFNYDLRVNEVTRYMEDSGKLVDTREYNAIYIAAKKTFDKLTFDLFDKLITSTFIPMYNPLREFFVKNRERQPTGLIDALFDTLLTTDYEFTRYFGKKWLVSIIASAHGEHSPLMLILSGEKHGTGKTQFLRRLFPKDLLGYVADISSGMKDNDLHILMTQKLLLIDDEFEGKSRRDEIALKSMLSKQVFSLREPYGRRNVDLIRLAVLCGTSNEKGLLNDPTGNRRILPIQVFSINHRDYNAIDKTDLLMEAYQLWKSGFNWELTADDIKLLNDNTEIFQAHTVEYELVMKFYEVPQSEQGAEFMTATEIKVELEALTNQKLTLDRLGKELQRAGFKQESKRMVNGPRKVYKVIRVNRWNNKP